jgi:hypothetical protein
MRSVLIAALAAMSSVAVTAAPGDQLPDLAGETLAKTKIAWPKDFPTDRVLLLVSFGRDMQAEVDAWDAALTPLRSDTLAIFNTPLIPNPGAIVRGFITGGMRSIYKDESARARMVPLYVDEKKIFPRLGITERATPLILVYTRDGRELGRVQGKVSADLRSEVERIARQP